MKFFTLITGNGQVLNIVLRQISSGKFNGGFTIKDLIVADGEVIN